MRWRVHNIPPDVRKIARDAAKAEGLSLGLWLDRAILQSAHLPPPADGAARVTPAASNGHSEDVPSHVPMSSPADRGAPEHGRDDARAGDEQSNGSLASAEQAAAPSRGFSRLRPSKRAPVVLAAAALVAMIAGTVALWHFSSGFPGSRQATSPGQSSSSSPAPAPTAQQPPTPAPQSLAEIIDGLQRDAQNGDAMAQHDLALAYVNGRGVPQNYQIAAQWFEKAAAAGLERAQFNLAVLYENALGVPEDLERAFTLYSAAAEQGFALAQHNLAVAYAQGRGTSRDYQAAALWFRRAADQGVASAQYNLGMIYEKGLAGPPDEQTAYGWYRTAAASGSEAAMARLVAIEGRIAAPPASAKPGPRATKPTAAEITEIQRLLSQLAFNPGTADGKPGKATREAIRQYQQVAGLPVDGEPSQTLLAHLRQVTNMMRSGGR